MKQAIAKADVLLEALPYLRTFAGQTFVVKYGGSIQDMPGGEESVILDVLLLHTAGIWPVIVHGGGKEISEAQKKLGIAPRFVQGLRVTDARTMKVTAAVLGRINRRIVARLRRHGDHGAGCSGAHGGVVLARKKVLRGGEDLGFVGEVAGFNLAPLRRARRAGRIPILSSVGVGARGALYNINADDVAGALAARLTAAKLILMTDVAGIQDGAGNLLSSITAAQARALIGSGVITKGMIPKVKSCLGALSGGVAKAHVIDGRLRHSLLLEIFTARGVGTEIRLRP
ncbi:MAG: acetylglutamate kinase [bacterium]